MKNDTRKLYEVSNTELENLFHAKAVEEQGNASVKSFINDGNLWDSTVSEVLEILETPIAE